MTTDHTKYEREYCVVCNRQRTFDETYLRRVGTADSIILCQDCFENLGIKLDRWGDQYGWERVGKENMGAFYAITLRRKITKERARREYLANILAEHQRIFEEKIWPESQQKK